MTPQNITTNLELSKELKEAGYPQDNCVFYWLVFHDQDIAKIKKPELVDWKHKQKNDIGQKYYQYYAAPTSSELGERLRPYLQENIWLLEIREAMNNATYMKDEANARAKMYLYLKKHNLLKGGKER